MCDVYAAGFKKLLFGLTYFHAVVQVIAVMILVAMLLLLLLPHNLPHSLQFQLAFFPFCPKKP